MNLVRICLLHFQPGRPPTTRTTWWHRSAVNQNSGLLLFWVLALIWWNVARLLPVEDQFAPVSDLVEIIISILTALQMYALPSPS